ncbi:MULTISPECIES: Nudix family hydrolase [Thiorhodovibrio]|uniref:Nudix family hydrolase n=1 Tax=Thiorhodovibrio TaxID=61593 RepID=UPI001913B419|nr:MULTISPECIES: Nudix family hydrolase [Thiorhodovibrio]MBK5968218.1 thiamine monophosphate synthase [Thiorhodovibrio winogradskyi]WPL14772.1 8-oxo-dGTP diphosphatase [Thiorhodovibrio litoralis]
MSRATIHVVAGVLRDGSGRVLIAQRPAQSHQGGRWEFPGGKLEPAEQPVDGLRRELHEELGIALQASRPLIQVEHDYGDRHVLLDVHLVLSYRGEPRGCEGQPLAWSPVDALDPDQFPPADRPVISALKLPSLCLITPQDAPDATDPAQEPRMARFLACFERATDAGAMLVQLRAHDLSDSGFAALARAAAPIFQACAIPLVLNRSPEVIAPLLHQQLAQGMHLSAARLHQLSARPLTGQGLVGASCHTAEDLAHAGELQLDYALLSPVQPTRSHPGAQALGWDGFARLVRPARLPVYALGGLTADDVHRAWAYGAQGVAAIRGLWPC